jgi:hypothetical protein
LGDFAEEPENLDENDVFIFDKEDEKHLHIFNYKGNK